MPLSIHIPGLEEHITTQRDFANFLNGGTRKVTMDIKQKQRAIIEFLLSEGCEGDDIVLRLQNAHDRDAYCGVSVFR
jgi:ribosome maturation factor RimP